ncbi:hypothetical protein Ahy_Scaffold1g107477 [Arachis hypogaea]|uniref:rhamnogalacturonan endolyase n=1 Tax=Arachis hypogaea TaxID=3818 RepID=A0A444WW14_ARAHY|nr:hypothetical protein Ahy_Scaffold1g107477 [Arachis hypogaea]
MSYYEYTHHTIDLEFQVILQNGIVSITLAKPGGYILEISYNGIDTILESRNDKKDRGYVDFVTNEPGESGGEPKTETTDFKVIAQDQNMVEVSFTRTWSPSDGGVPFNIDIRYILRRGDSGFYPYVILERVEGFPAVEIDQIRIVFKLARDRFRYMAISNTRQRMMPSMADRENGQTLDYPEAVLLTKPLQRNFLREVDDKYQYSIETQDNKVNGWTSPYSEPRVGFWILTPSNEFRNCGPIKQDLTSHVGPIALSMFVSNHYAGREVNMKFQEGELYKKVFGPVFIYLNSGPSNQNLWLDAVQKQSNEAKSWPYNFPRSIDFIPANKRGTISGRLQVQDRFMKGQSLQNANSAYVGLGLPGDPGSWQKESKVYIYGYQFWTRTDKNGNFVINNIVPGDYNLYAWVPGFIGDYKYNKTITITPGCSTNLNTLVYNPPRNGPTLWEIGIPDRLAAEFFVPDANPKLINNLYRNHTIDKFRQYGLWERYAELHPHNDLVFVVGANDYRKDWYFAHVTRKIGEKKYRPCTWQIVFDLPNVTSRGIYTLQLALASSTEAELQVWFNDPKNANPAHFTTGQVGGDNAIARHGIHGLYRLYSIGVSGKHLVKGKNIIYLKQSKALTAFEGVMYDYIRLEGPPPSSPGFDH